MAQLAGLSCGLQVPGALGPKRYNGSLVIQAALCQALNQDSGMQHQQLPAAHGQGWLMEDGSRGSVSHPLMEVTIGWTQDPRGSG